MSEFFRTFSKNRFQHAALFGGQYMQESFLFL